jgi:prophage regulatory protein
MTAELATPADATKSPDAWMEDERLVCGRTVQRIVGMSRTSIYRLVRAGKFPKPLNPTPGRNMWRLDVVKAWKAELEAPKS